MAASSRDTILEKSKQLAQIIAETEEVKTFQQAECKIKQHAEVQQLMKKLKKLQQQAVNLKHIDKQGALEQTEAEIEKVYSELNDYPIVNEFMSSQQEVNALLQLVSTTISTKVTDEIIRQTGGDLLRGKTGTNGSHNHG